MRALNELLHASIDYAGLFPPAQLDMTTAVENYARYLASDWKKEQDAMQKAGYVLSYKAIRTEAHNPTECNVILMTEYKGLATMEANADKAEQLGQELFGGISKVEAGYTDRSSYRDVIGSRLAREIILEPKK